MLKKNNLALYWKVLTHSIWEGDDLTQYYKVSISQTSDIYKKVIGRLHSKELYRLIRHTYSRVLTLT